MRHYTCDQHLAMRHYTCEQHLNGTNILRVAENCSKRTFILTVIPLHWWKCQCSHALMHKCWQLTVLEMTEGIWISVGCLSQFWLQTGGCSMSLHLHSMTASCSAETVSVGHLHRPFAESWSGPKHHEINYYRWSDVGPCVATVTVKVKVIPKTDKSEWEREPIESKDCTQCVLRMLRFGAL